MRHTLFTALYLASILLCVCASTPAHAISVNTTSRADVVIATDRGVLKGFRRGGLRIWRGVRYAAPPIDARRWQPPAPPARWTGVRHAFEFGDPCPQGPSFTGIPSTDEDCLFLNIYAPDDSQSHPVMVWIHGGGFVTGAANRFDPTRLVHDGVVVVTLNYRLGALGFLAREQKSRVEQKGKSSFDSDFQYEYEP